MDAAQSEPLLGYRNRRPRTFTVMGIGPMNRLELRTLQAGNMLSTVREITDALSDPLTLPSPQRGEGTSDSYFSNGAKYFG